MHFTTMLVMHVSKHYRKFNKSLRNNEFSSNERTKRSNQILKMYNIVIALQFINILTLRLLLKMNIIVATEFKQSESQIRQQQVKTLRVGVRHVYG